MRSAHASLPGVHNHLTMDPSLSLNALHSPHLAPHQSEALDLGWPQPDRRPESGHRNEPVPVWNLCWWRQPLLTLNQAAHPEHPGYLMRAAPYSSLLNTWRESMWASQSCGMASQWGRDNRGQVHWLILRDKGDSYSRLHLSREKETTLSACKGSSTSETAQTCLQRTLDKNPHKHHFLQHPSFWGKSPSSERVGSKQNRTSSNLTTRALPDPTPIRAQGKFSLTPSSNSSPSIFSSTTYQVIPTSVPQGKKERHDLHPFQTQISHQKD